MSGRCKGNVIAVHNRDPVERSETITRVANMAQSMQEHGEVQIRSSVALQKGRGAARDCWSLQDAEKTSLIQQKH